MNEKKYHDNEEAGLVDAVKHGDKDAFARLYRRYFSELCDISFYVTRDKEVAKELVQDTFLVIWEKRKDWQPKGSIRSYLFRAVKNRSLDYLKHVRVERGWKKMHQRDITESDAGEEAMSQKELAAAIDRSVDELPEKCRIIFIMNRNQGFTYGEIAEIQGISQKTVETQIGRALKKLRESLSRHLPHHPV
ncbi:MAG: RNA polymerase sigma-70 factor [Balneolaceae bacterium]|nr:MAG: RNA polymerase sigma-70 factor [Balneolaceae bacterium]